MADRQPFMLSIKIRLYEYLAKASKKRRALYRLKDKVFGILDHALHHPHANVDENI